jgi:membrane protein implicated in regulation of membrane protease activity
MASTAKLCHMLARRIIRGSALAIGIPIVVSPAWLAWISVVVLVVVAVVLAIIWPAIWSKNETRRSDAKEVLRTLWRW